MCAETLSALPPAKNKIEINNRWNIGENKEKKKWCHVQEPLQCHRVLDEVGCRGASNRQGYLFCQHEILWLLFQSGEAVDSGLNASSGAQIWGLRKNQGGWWIFNKRVNYFWDSWLNIFYLMRCIFKKQTKKTVMWDQVYETGVGGGKRASRVEGRQLAWLKDPSSAEG